MAKSLSIPNIPLTKQALPTRGMQSTTQIWLKQMSQRDSKLWGMQQQPLWIIDNKIYNLTQFINKHPGGSSWITMTKGQDITTLFITHHLQQQKTRQILQKYYKCQAKNKHQRRFQFNQHYQQIRKRILDKFTISKLQQTTKTQIICYALIIGWFLLLSLCSYLQSYALAIICGFLMMMLYGIGHMFIHRKTPNILSHVYLLIGFSARQQQIMHAISHHPYCNTMLDYQFSSDQPIMNFVNYLPTGKWYSFIVVQISFILIGPFNVLTKVIVNPILTKGKQSVSWQHLVFPLEIVFIYLFTQDLSIAFKLWIVMICTYGFTFGKMVVCPHRQIQLWSQNQPQIRDFVLHMIATTTDTNHNPISALTSIIFYSGFNIHVLHHLFPTIDHSKLFACNKIFMQYCKQKGLKVMVSKNMFQCNKNMWKLQFGRKQFQLKMFSD